MRRHHGLRFHQRVSNLLLHGLVWKLDLKVDEHQLTAAASPGLVWRRSDCGLVEEKNSIVGLLYADILFDQYWPLISY